MAEYGKAQKAVTGTLLGMLVISFLLVVAQFAVPTNSNAGTLGEPYPVDQCMTACGWFCMYGGCCDYDPNRNPPCYGDKVAWIAHCEEYWPPEGCLTGWQCTGVQCNAGCCYP